jgi:hypothetical protein
LPFVVAKQRSREGWECFFPAQTVGKKVREMLNEVNSYRLFLERRVS